MLFGRDGHTTKYELDGEIKSGGEGVVYSIKGKPNSVAKLYKHERIVDFESRERAKDKILAMLDMDFNPYLNNRLIVAWPEDALFDSAHVFQGFVMPKIQNMKSLIWASRPSDRNALWPNGYRWHYSVAIAFNLALTIEHLHKAGIIVGDLNINNILIDAKGDVTLIDADSFNIRSKTGQIYKCIVGFPEVLPPELQGKDLTEPTHTFSEKTDTFSLAIHIFSLICNNCHPFGCLNYNVAHGSSSSPKLMDNILKGYCPYVTGAKGKTVDDALDMDVFPSELRSLFDRTFHYDASTAVKQSTIANRPSAEEWRIALGNLYQSGVESCQKNPLHEYPKNYTKGCPWCAIEERKKLPEPTPPSKPQTKDQTTQNSTATSAINPTTPTPPKQSHGARHFFIFLLVAGILYCIIMYGAAKTAMNNGDYEQAKHYMDLFPFYQDLFPAEYDNINYQIRRIENERSEQTRLSNYNQAVDYYRSGYYSEAYDLFGTIDSSYNQTSLYLDFCQAHMYWPDDYYYTIFNNIYFEDAMSLLAWDDQMFCKYMKGTWKTSTTYGDQYVSMTENSGGNYTVSGLPELPGGGTFSISYGVMQYLYENTENWVDFFQIEIISQDCFYLYSYQSGTTYYFYRE